MEHGLLRARDWSRAGRSSTSRLPLVLPLVAILAGAAAGSLARVLDVYGARPLSAIGAGAALWLTLAFAVARRGRTIAWAVAATALFLAFWLVGYYTTDAGLLGVPLRTMWPVARPWFAVLLPAAAGIGTLASLSTRRGRVGDVALGLPLVWSVAEGLLWIDRESVASGVVALAILVAVALAVVAVERRRRPVHLRLVLAAGLAGVVPFGVVALWVVSLT